MNTAGTAELQLLLDLAQATSEAGDLGSALDGVTDRICRATGWGAGEAWLDDGGGRAPEWMQRAKAGRRPVWREDSDSAATVVIPILSDTDCVGAMLFDVGRRSSEAERLAVVVALAAANLGAWLKRKHAEDSVRVSEERLRLLIEHVGDAVFMLENDATIATWSPVAERMLGYSAAEAIGRHVGVFHDAGGTREAFEEALTRARTTGRFETDGWRVRKDGSRFWARNVTCAIRDASGAVIGFAKIVRDLTAVRIAEEIARQHAQELARSNRELEEFASIASHDLQEPLRKILAFSGRLQSRCASALDEQGTHYLDRLQDASRRMQKLVDDLLNYSRVASRPHSFTAVNLDVVAADVVRDLESTIEARGGRVELGALPTIEADETQMRQLLQNLIANGLKFCATEQRPFVRLTSRRRERTGHDDEPRWELSIADAGIGFDEKFVERIFGMLQRLHGRAEYEGNGMGLAICRRIAERHRGTITARSALGQGATFVVTVPERQTAIRNGDGQ